MAGKWLLDSTVVVDLFRGDDGIAERIRETDVAITLVVLGELLYGSNKSQRQAQNQDQLEAFVEDCEMLVLTRTTSRHYGELKLGQHHIGKMIPDNDLWIAASAREHGLRLAHRDNHFPMIPDFDQKRW